MTVAMGMHDLCCACGACVAWFCAAVHRDYGKSADRAETEQMYSALIVSHFTQLFFYPCKSIAHNSLSGLPASKSLPH